MTDKPLPTKSQIDELINSDRVIADTAEEIMNSAFPKLNKVLENSNREIVDCIHYRKCSHVCANQSCKQKNRFKDEDGIPRCKTSGKIEDINRMRFYK